MNSFLLGSAPRAAEEGTSTDAGGGEERESGESEGLLLQFLTWSASIMAGFPIRSATVPLAPPPLMAAAIAASMVASSALASAAPASSAAAPGVLKNIIKKME